MNMPVEKLFDSNIGDYKYSTVGDDLSYKTTWGGSTSSYPWEPYLEYRYYMHRPIIEESKFDKAYRLGRKLVEKKLLRNKVETAGEFFKLVDMLLELV